MLTLAGKGALLAGTKRMGAVVAHRLAAEGVGLAITYRNSRAEAENLQQSLMQETTRSCLIQGDVSVEEDVQRIVRQAGEELGGLSFVINLASDFPRTPIDTLDAQSWERSMATAKGSYLMALHGARQMMKNDGPTRGHILLFTDWAAGATPYRDYLPYLIAKSSIDFMTRAFAVELAPKGILVNAIAPGPTMRPPENSEASWQRDVRNKTLLRRESSADEMAELVVTLLKSETITGETIRVDSGRHLAGPGVE